MSREYLCRTVSPIVEAARTRNMHNVLMDREASLKDPRTIPLPQGNAPDMMLL